MTVKTVPERPAPHPYPLTAAQTRDVYYGYDLRGLQTFARFDSVSGEGITTGYDGFGRVRTSSTNMGGVTRTLSYINDADGNRCASTIRTACSSLICPQPGRPDREHRARQRRLCLDRRLHDQPRLHDQRA
jgi:hypothetical protein